MSNLYWPVYKNLEKEVIELSYSINFDDTQFEYLMNSDSKYIKTPPYSVKIGDLLVRCCTEIEALIQELTRGKDEEVKQTPTVDPSRPITTGCRLKYLHNIFGLDKKVVIVSCLSMFFNRGENKSFSPFDYERDSHDDYYSAYNAIKHNRNDKTIHKGNIRYLLRAIASLYLLNIYYKNEPIFLGKNPLTNSIPSSSDLFAVDTIMASSTDSDNTVKATLSQFKQTVASVFIIKTTKESRLQANEASKIYMELINSKIEELKLTNPHENIETLKLKAFRLVPQAEFMKIYENSEYEAVILKPKDTANNGQLRHAGFEVGLWLN
jgi:hypothetical protein